MVKNEVLTYYPKVPTEKIVVVHNGVAWHAIEQDATSSLQKKPALCQEFGLNPKKHQLLFVGNEYQRKGLDLLLEACAMLSQDDFELSVVGKEKNIQRFSHYAKKLGLKNNVHFFGQRKDITSFYQIADTVVIPSFYDPFANVTTEALAMGVYVVSSKNNGGSEILVSDTLGVAFEDMQTSKELVSCLEKALTKPKTEHSLQAIRQEVAYLDFSNQIDAIVSKTVATC